MATPRDPGTPPSPPDGAGVRVVRKPGGTRGARWLWVVGIVVLAGVAAWWLRTPGPAADGYDVDGPDAAAPASARGPDAGPAVDPGEPAISHHKQPPTPGDDPDDLAAYFAAGDPEPSGAEVIAALQDAGVRTGIAAFNPPGTSPPLVGLAVPDDFDLPEGYVRHHQVTDEGVPIEPILMFSPDFTLYDAQGRRVPIPADRVVPPALAPPGLPLRRIQIPPR